MRRVRNGYLVLTGLLAVFAFEARIVFGSFRSFIALPYPWSVLLVTGGILTAAFIAFNLFVIGDRCGDASIHCYGAEKRTFTLLCLAPHSLPPGLCL